MAKCDNKTKQAKSGTTATSIPEPAANSMEQRLTTFAEQLGWMAGTIHTKAEGWMDGDTLSKQIASVRDTAAQLLDQLKGGTTTATGEAIGRRGDAPTKQRAERRCGRCARKEAS